MPLIKHSVSQSPIDLPVILANSFSLKRQKIFLTPKSAICCRSYPRVLFCEPGQKQRPIQKVSSCNQVMFIQELLFRSEKSGTTSNFEREMSVLKVLLFFRGLKTVAILVSFFISFELLLESLSSIFQSTFLEEFYLSFRIILARSISFSNLVVPFSYRLRSLFLRSKQQH